MEKALEGLPEKIIQATSDEGTGICRHIKEDFGAHHSPDLFHIQHDLAKGTNGPLSKNIKKAHTHLESASNEVNLCIDKKRAYD